MFSYRHSFHAGNHADVLKHACQMAILQSLTKKNKPAIYIDTHSGAGRYDLRDENALKTREFETGVSRLASLNGSSSLLTEYQNLVQYYQQQFQYPGSPYIASHLMREQDKIVLIEFLASEVDNLKHNMRDVDNAAPISIHHRDGYEGLLAMLPPKPARGLVLIDPPYEQASEYRQVYQTMQKAVQKWSTGVFAIWYPLLSARAQNKSGLSEKLRDQLALLDIKSALSVELTVEDNLPDSGMYGSGMVIINPPWQLDLELTNMMAQLAPILGKKQSGKGRVSWLKTEAQ